MLRQLFLFLLLAIGHSLSVAQETITSLSVFYSSKDETPSPTFHDIPVAAFPLDRPTQLEQDLSQHLPSQFRQAETVIDRILNTPQGQQQLLEIAKSYQPIAQALQLGIQAIPAVVINRRYVVYGTTDLHQAIRHWRSWEDAS